MEPTKNAGDALHAAGASAGHAASHAGEPAHDFRKGESRIGRWSVGDSLGDPDPTFYRFGHRIEPRCKDVNGVILRLRSPIC